MKQLNYRIKAGVLSTVIVVSMLMLSAVMALVAWWDMDVLLFSDARSLKIRQTDLQSASLLYSTHPEDFPRRENELVLFENRPSSCVKIEPEPWGLYESVCFTVGRPEFGQAKLMGLRAPSALGAGFYHPENRMSVTLAGNTNILTQACLPRNGFLYGQLNARFFNGREVSPSQMKPASPSFPAPSAQARARVDSIFSAYADGGDIPAHVTVPFYRHGALVLSAPDDISHCELNGKIVVTGQRLKVDSTCRFSDIVLVCSSLVIGRGFQGSMQVFARDSVTVEPQTRLLYPSGIYAGRWVSLSDSAQVNGYIVVNPGGETGIAHPHYVSTPGSLVRGFIYVNGNAQLQGVVSGSVFVREAMYYAPTGYYRGMICDFTLLENPGVVYPVWLDNGKRREAKWVK